MRTAGAKAHLSEARLSNAQDKVLEGYKARFGLRPPETQNLHMFFSPSRIPKGLTEEEIRIVLLLHQLRDTHRRHTIEKMKRLPGIMLPEFSSVLNKTALPRELRPLGRMTRNNFQKGVIRLLQHMVTR